MRRQSHGRREPAAPTHHLLLDTTACQLFVAQCTHPGTVCVCVRLCEACAHTAKHTCANVTSVKRRLSIHDNILGCVQMMSKTKGETRRAALDKDVQSHGEWSCGIGHHSQHRE